jgi:hypothetical protein
MKLMFVLRGSSGVLAVLLACIVSAHGGSLVSPTPFIVLSGVSVPEIPAKAAEMVHAASVPNRGQTARDVLQAVSALARPGVMPYVVSAICHGSPEVAGDVVATAIGLQPHYALIFSKAAVCAAPGQVEQIVFSTCKAAPGLYADVSLVAFGQLPSSRDSILAGLLGAYPGLKPLLEEAQAQVGTNDFRAVIKRTGQLLADAYKAQQ